MKTPWFEHAVIYQIYPLSFKDSNADGIGDIRGIIEKLDYLAGNDQSLGVTGIWICPFFKSPMKDHGYDISDYCDIDPRFGTLADFEELIREAHARGIRILIDFVTNHTSDEHPWFKESRSSTHNSKRYWYIWKKPGADGGPPNNWKCVPGNSAWTLDEKTGEYYFHQFLPEQPDLDWRNPEVVRAMSHVLNFWLEKGVDGFRIDAISHIYEDVRFQNEPENPYFNPHDGGISAGSYNSLTHIFSKDQPALKEVIALLSVIGHKKDAFIVSEAYLPPEKLREFYDLAPYRNHVPFNFNLLTEDFTPASLRSIIYSYESNLKDDYIRTYVLGNHDQRRVASRIGKEKVRLAALLQLTLPGIPFIYYGEELGMENTEIQEDATPYPELASDGFKTQHSEWNRDAARTPMQWDADLPNFGFGEATPWLPAKISGIPPTVAEEQITPNSLLNLYKALIRIRKDNPLLIQPGIQFIDTKEDILMYTRGGDTWCICLNFSSQAQHIHLPPHAYAVTLRTDTCTGEDAIIEGAYSLPPYSGVLLKRT